MHNSIRQCVVREKKLFLNDIIISSANAVFGASWVDARLKNVRIENICYYIFTIKRVRGSLIVNYILNGRK